MDYNTHTNNNTSTELYIRMITDNTYNTPTNNNTLMDNNTPISYTTPINEL